MQIRELATTGNLTANPLPAGPRAPEPALGLGPSLLPRGCSNSPFTENRCKQRTHLFLPVPGDSRSDSRPEARTAEEATADPHLCAPGGRGGRRPDGSSHRVPYRTPAPRQQVWGNTNTRCVRAGLPWLRTPRPSHASFCLFCGRNPSFRTDTCCWRGREPKERPRAGRQRSGA